MNDFVTAAKNLIARCDELRTLALSRRHAIAELFKPKEAEKTIDICMDFLCAIADSSARELRANATLIAKIQEHVSDANATLDAQMLHNPLAMSFVTFAENSLFERLSTHPADIISHAKKARRARPLIKALLRFVFSDIYRQTAEEKARKPFRKDVARIAFMRQQKRIFNAYLKHHPVKPGFSYITRAHECWLLHKEVWNKAADEGRGYSDHKALART